MKNRKATLYDDYKKTKPLEEVTVLYIGQVGCRDEGFMIVASVERENGEIVEVPHDKLRFNN